MSVIDTSKAPYFNDYSEAKQFLDVLFRPSQAVQARELNQLQTYGQEQVSRLASHIFKKGSRVLNGNTAIDNAVEYVKVTLDVAYSAVEPYLIDGSTLVGQTNNIVAEVKGGSNENGADPITFYVDYIDGGNNTQSRFIDGETLQFLDTNSSLIGTATVAASGTGQGTKASITEGIFYIADRMIRINAQDVIVDRYSTTPDASIGFQISESVVTEFEDTSLLDNAQGSENYAAPGAHRYKIELVLLSKALGYESDDFIELIRVESGKLVVEVRGTDYNELGDTLAERTYEESGDYTVDPFIMTLKEHLDDGTNNGAYTAGNGGDASKLVASLDAGVAYVSGSRIETIATTNVDVDKARDFAYANNSITYMQVGNYTTITGLYNCPDITNFATLSLRDTVISTPGTQAGAEVGTARVRAVENVDNTDVNLYLFDIQMNAGKTFADDVKSIYQSGGKPVTADTKLVSGKAVINKASNNKAIFKMPYDMIKSIRAAGGGVDTTYSVRKKFSTTIDGSGDITLTAGTDEVFAPYTIADYLVVITSGVNAGTVVNTLNSGDYVLSGTPTGKVMTIAVTGNNNESVDVITTIIKTVAQEKTKALTVHNMLGTAPATSISLTKADIQSVSITDAVTSQDMTDYFILDNGQRDNFYGIGKITLKPTHTLPSNNLDIVVNYFVHGAGDYFSVDSYDVDYEDIPSHTTVDGTKFELRDCLDFRPTKSTSNDFTSAGADVGLVMKPQSSASADFSYYLNRIDIVYLNNAGNFVVNKGISSLNPTAPTVPSNVMHLYTLEIPAYTMDSSNVSLKLVENKRYTMRDINKLETRIKNLEYYNALTLLEKETADMQILDGAGLDRYKNGFAVDTFNNYNLSNTASTEFQASLDVNLGICRPAFDNTFVGLELKSVTNVSNNANTITLPFTSATLIDQAQATKSINVNPYAVFRWNGVVTMTPSSDTWHSTRYVPSVVINGNVNDQFSGLSGAQILALPPRDTNLGIAWGAWNTTWFGSNWFGLQNGVNSRTGTSSVRVDRTVARTVDDSVVDVSAIPFMREKLVEFSIDELKPNTRYYPRFDDVDVARFCKPTGGSFGQNLVSSAAGVLAGTLLIPEGGATLRRYGIAGNELRFKTGDRIFRISDHATHDRDLEMALGEFVFTSKGILNTRQKTIIATRTSQVNTTTVAQSTNVRRRNWRNEGGNGGDPIAQSFIARKTGGTFITKVDLFFKTKDPRASVKVQIREMENGYPSLRIVPFGESVNKSGSVNLSNDGSVATTFSFDDPVFLQEGVEYCFVVMTNSTRYNMFIAEMGGNDLITGNTVAKQPHTGSMFKSQNNSTWTADQNSDVKFKIYNAEFSVGTKTFELQNSSIDNVLLPINSVESTNASTAVKVEHLNHGLITGDSVTVSGSVNGNGILASELNGTHVISKATVDTYEITLTTAATSSGRFGGDKIIASKNAMFNIANAIVQTNAVDGTSVGWGIKTTSGKSYSGTETAYNFDNAFASVNIGENIEFATPRLIASDDNDTGNGYSMVLQGSMTTDKSNLSPVIDKDRMGVALIHNRINDPQPTDEGYVVETDSTDGSAYAKYLTKPITLAQNANALRVLFSANRPQQSAIDVYYKLSNAESDTPFDDIDYVMMTAVEDSGESDSGEFLDYEFEAENLQDFNVFAIKVVYRSTNSSNVPQVKDFRAIALGT